MAPAWPGPSAQPPPPQQIHTPAQFGVTRAGCGDFPAAPPPRAGSGAFAFATCADGICPAPGDDRGASGCHWRAGGGANSGAWNGAWGGAWLGGAVRVRGRAGAERSGAMGLGPGLGPGLGLGLCLWLRLWLLLGALCGAASGLHSLRYFHVALSEPSPGLPQITIVGYVDGNPFVRYDSETGKVEPQADWVRGAVDLQYLEKSIQEVKHIDHMCLHILRGRYNQSKGAHTLQRMVGCDLLEDNSTRGYMQKGYDGRDFIVFDMDTMTFTAADAVAQITKRKWEVDGTEAEQWKHYLKGTCIEWLRKYVSYGRAVLERKERPVVQVSGKEAYGILTLSCRAYGFYPRPIRVSWLKDSEVRDQDTKQGGIMPNSDGTYYTWASIETLPEEKDKYRCRVEHASLREPGHFVWEPESKPFTILLAVAAAVLAVIAIIAGVALWKYKSGKKKDYTKTPSTDGGSDSSTTGVSILKA